GARYRKKECLQNRAWPFPGSREEHRRRERWKRCSQPRPAQESTVEWSGKGRAARREETRAGTGEWRTARLNHPGGDIAGQRCEHRGGRKAHRMEVECGSDRSRASRGDVKGMNT